MIGILEKIFIKYNYKTESIYENTIFAQMSNKEYYIAANYEGEEISNFFECDKTIKIIQSFKELKEREDDIKKNTSLFICINVGETGIEKFNDENRNFIYQIEEDEYYFRKYVILYSDKVIQNSPTFQPDDINLFEIISNQERMDKFEQNCFADEEFYLAMQLIIKLPFLTPMHTGDKYTTVEQTVSEVINRKNLIDIENRVKNFINDSDTDNISYFDLLENEMLNTLEDEDILSEFFEYFEV